MFRQRINWFHYASFQNLVKTKKGTKGKPSVPYTNFKTDITNYLKATPKPVKNCLPALPIR